MECVSIASWDSDVKRWMSIKTCIAKWFSQCICLLHTPMWWTKKMHLKSGYRWNMILNDGRKELRKDAQESFIFMLLQLYSFFKHIMRRITLYLVVDYKVSPARKTFFSLQVCVYVDMKYGLCTCALILYQEESRSSMKMLLKIVQHAECFEARMPWFGL